MNVYFKNKRNEHFKLSLFTERSTDIDSVLDQLNLGKLKVIDKSEFHVLEKTLIDVTDESGELIGILTCSKF